MGRGFRFRLWGLVGLLAVAGAAVGGRLFSLQVAGRERLVALAERQLERALWVQPRRGEILDRRGRPLAVSLDVVSLYAHPPRLERPREVAAGLARALHLPEGEVVRKLTSGKAYVWVKRQLTPEEAARVGEAPEGVGLAAEAKRYYPMRELAGHLLGFVGLDNRGLEGAEYQFESWLAGRPGLIRVERDGRGRPVGAGGLRLRAAAPGGDVVLTLDAALQYIVERELRAQVERTGARGGVALMLEPSTGALLAVARVPVFNPNSFGRYRPEEWRQGAFTDAFEPGSIFKVVVVAAYLEAGLGEREELFYGEGGAIHVGGATIRDHQKFGWLTLSQVLEHSSNVGAIKVAQRVGPRRLFELARRFGFGEPLGVDFPGEGGGLLRTPRRWSARSLASVAIGQEVAVTPLQMAAAMAAIAKGGIAMAPRVAEALAREGKVVRRFPAREMGRPLSPATARRLARMLEAAVERGTGRGARVEGYRVAGKTGTAQKADPKAGGYSEEKMVASFVGFAPVEDPRFVLLVALDEPRPPAWGGTAAAPAFARIARAALRYLRVPARGTEVIQVARGRVAPGNSSP